MNRQDSNGVRITASRRLLAVGAMTAVVVVALIGVSLLPGDDAAPTLRSVVASADPVASERPSDSSSQIPVAAPNEVAPSADAMVVDATTTTTGVASVAPVVVASEVSPSTTAHPRATTSTVPPADPEHGANPGGEAASTSDSPTTSTIAEDSTSTTSTTTRAPTTPTTIGGGGCAYGSHPRTFQRGETIAVPIVGAPNATVTVNLQTPAVANTHLPVTLDGQGRGQFELPTDSDSPAGLYGLRCWGATATTTVFTTWTVT